MPDEHPRLDELLENWARWMRAADTDELACAMPGFWSSGSSDFESMVAHFDLKDALATEASIRDIPVDERLALDHKYLAAVWRMHRQDIDVVYLRARVSVSVGLRMRDVP